MTAEIKLINITKTYHKKKVLDCITLSFTLGKAYMLVDENGSGKSTILKLITGLIFPSRGTIDTGDLSISYIPEKVMLPENIRVVDFLTILLEIKKAKISKMNELLIYFDLDKKLIEKYEKNDKNSKFFIKDITYLQEDQLCKQTADIVAVVKGDEKQDIQNIKQLILDYYKES